MAYKASDFNCKYIKPRGKGGRYQVQHLDGKIYKIDLMRKGNRWRTAEWELSDLDGELITVEDTMKQCLLAIKRQWTCNGYFKKEKKMGFSRECVNKNKTVFDKYLEDGEKAWFLRKDGDWQLVWPLFNRDGHIYVEDDKYAELRKSRATRETIQVFTCDSYDESICNVSNCEEIYWSDMIEGATFSKDLKFYRVKNAPWKWEDEISEEDPILCRVWDNSDDKIGEAQNKFRLIHEYYPNTPKYDGDTSCFKYGNKVAGMGGNTEWWRRAIPVKQDIKEKGSIHFA